MDKLRHFLSEHLKDIVIVALFTLAVFLFGKLINSLVLGTARSGMVWIVNIFTCVYLFVIVLTADPRTTFPRLGKKLTPEGTIHRENSTMDRIPPPWTLSAITLCLWTLWLAYKYRY
jgi:hypothetical protein